MLSPKIKQTRRARSKSMVLGELSRLSRPSSPLDQERALKSGWLKRQRSIMKNWQLRWFVLRTEALYFYKDQEESKAQGCIPLHGSQVNELPANQDEPARHLFEMVPGGSGEKERTALSPESFLLMANSQSDMEDWVRAIRRAIWAPLGGGVFGQHLEETMMCEVQCGPHRLVPGLVEQCVAFIRQQGLEEEGLFRAPGQTNHVRELQDAFDRGEKPVMDSATDVHTVASLLKLYLRELPEPVIPFSKYTQFLSCAQFLIKDKETGIQELIKQVKALPQVNYNLLKYICKFLDEVQSHSSGNKMSVQNLATVFGPNILRPRVEDPITMMEGSSHVQHLMTVLISEHSRLYQRAEPDIRTTTSPLEVQQSPGQRCMVAWQSQEDMDHLPCSSPASGPIPPAEEPRSALATREPSPDTKPSLNTPQETNNKEEDEGQGEQKRIGKATEKIEEKAEGKSGGGAAISPSKQSKGLPAWKCSLKGGAAAGSGGAKGKLGGSAGDVSAVSGGNWLMNGLSSLRVHRRTASSGERLKDSTLSLKESTLSLKEASLRNARKDSLEESQSAISSSLSNRTTPSHRLSAYDNVTATPSSLNTPPESSSLWTSCEIPLDDLAGSDPGLGSEVVMLSAQEELSEAGDSSDQLDRCVSSTGCNEAEPGEDTLQGQGLGRNEGLTSRVAELKQELKKQRITYDTSIHKLEESCSRYQLQLGQLEEDLYQEKKRFHMLEIRLRNSERARQDAESRNTALQKEMEEFFKTLGDLTTGAPQTN